MNKEIPDSEGVWSISVDQPPILVLSVYGELQWSQIGFCDWSSMKTLKKGSWEKIYIPFFERYGK